MARRNRRKRGPPQSWAVQGSDETIQRFSNDRMQETLSNNQLEAMNVMADMRALELQAQSFMAMLEASTNIQQAQLTTLQQGLQNLATLQPAQQQQLLETLTALTRAQQLPQLGNE